MVKVPWNFITLLSLNQIIYYGTMIEYIFLYTIKKEDHFTERHYIGWLETNFSQIFQIVYISFTRKKQGSVLPQVASTKGVSYSSFIQMFTLRSNLSTLWNHYILQITRIGQVNDLSRTTQLRTSLFWKKTYPEKHTVKNRVSCSFDDDQQRHLHKAILSK